MAEIRGEGGRARQEGWWRVVQEGADPGIVAGGKR